MEDAKEFINEISRILNNSKNNIDEDIVNTDQVVHSLENMNTESEDLFSKICTGTATMEQIKLYANHIGLDITGEELEQTLPLGFKKGQELAQEIESSLALQREEIENISQEVISNTFENTKEILNRLDNIEARLDKLDKHFISLLPVASSNNEESDNYNIYI